MGKLSNLFHRVIGLVRQPAIAPIGDAINVLSDNETVPGVRHYAIEVYGAIGHALVIDLSQNEIIVTHYKGNLLAPDTWYEDYGLHGAVNASGWMASPEYNIPNSIAASYGQIYQIYQKDLRPVINVTDDEIIQVTHRPSLGELWQCVSGDRYLVQNGEINPALYSRPYEKNARTLAGKTSTNRLVLITCEGWERHAPSNGEEPWMGWSFIEAANVMLGFGVTDGVNLDGGGSTWMRLLGDTLQPQNDDGYDRLRVLPNVIGFKAKGEVTPPEPPPTNGDTTMRYEAISNTHVLSLREDHSAYDPKIREVPLNTTFRGDEIFAPTEDVVIDGNLHNKAGDLWLHASEYQQSFAENPTPCDGWVGVIHMGKTYAEFTDNGTPTDPPDPTDPPKPTKVRVELADGSVYEATDFVQI